MFTAILNGKKVLPALGLRADCPWCGKEVGAWICKTVRSHFKHLNCEPCDESKQWPEGPEQKEEEDRLALEAKLEAEKRRQARENMPVIMPVMPVLKEYYKWKDGWRLCNIRTKEELGLIDDTPRTIWMLSGRLQEDVIYLRKRSNGIVTHKFQDAYKCISAKSHIFIIDGSHVYRVTKTYSNGWGCGKYYKKEEVWDKLVKAHGVGEKCKMDVVPVPVVKPEIDPQSSNFEGY